MSGFKNCFKGDLAFGVDPYLHTAGMTHAFVSPLGEIYFWI
jgi:hypothetical protein